MSPVASVSTAEVDNLEGEELRKYVFKTIQPVEILKEYKITERNIGAIISHHCGIERKRNPLYCLFLNVINANLVISPWRTRLGDDSQPVKGNDRRPPGMIGAPILIDGVKYLCNH